MKYIIALLLCLASSHANAFLVRDIDGKRIDTQEYVGNGRWTIVMLWQLNCPPCEQQKPFVDAFHSKYESSEAHVLGLVIDGHEYIPEIKKHIDANPNSFKSLVVFGDVFKNQILEETGKLFPAAPGYLIYSPSGKLELAINNIVDINELLGYVEQQFD